MKQKLIIPAIIAVSTVMLLSGCLAIGNRGGLEAGGSGTVGQQLIDLQKAKDAGIITPAEYQTQKDKVLGIKCK